MNDKQKVHLAYGISEMDVALAHLFALRQVGERVPLSKIRAVNTDLESLCIRWQQENSDVLWQDTAVVTAQARAWLASHLDELDALLKEERENDADNQE